MTSKITQNICLVGFSVKKNTARFKKQKVAMVTKLIFFPVGNSSFGNPQSLSSKEAPTVIHSNEIQIQIQIQIFIQIQIQIFIQIQMKYKYKKHLP